MTLLQQGKQPILGEDVNLEELAQLTESFTGADLAGLVRQASLQALRDSLKFESASEEEIDLKVYKQHFMSALQQMRPSVSTEVNLLLHTALNITMHFQIGHLSNNNSLINILGQSSI